MGLTPAKCLCLIFLALIGGITAFVTAPGTQALLREIALTTRAERREEAERTRRRRGKRAPEQD